ncbi:MAG: response regulator [Caulobacter sp.]
MTDRPLALVIDDDPLMLEFVSGALHEGGFDTQTAESAQSLLSDVHERKPAIVFLDVRMPGETGIEVLRRLRVSDWGREVPVVIMTGERRLDRVVEAMSAGATTYMMKPFTPTQLVLRARELTQPRESGSFHY